MFAAHAFAVFRTSRLNSYDELTRKLPAVRSNVSSTAASQTMAWNAAALTASPIESSNAFAHSTPRKFASAALIGA